MEKTMGRVFVGRLSRDTTEATLMDYFSNFGEVNDCFIIPDNITGCSKGYGFVSFIDSAMAEQALAQQDHVILGRKVDVKPATPRGEKKQEHGTNLQQKNEMKKIFVGGLPDGLSMTQFRTYFESYGPVKDVVVVHDINGKPRGFGFITFQSEDGASNALRQRFHELNNKRVEVKIAEPKERMVCSQDMTYDSYHAGLSLSCQGFAPYGQVSPYGYASAPYWYCYPYGYASSPLPWYAPYGYTSSPFHGYWDMESSSSH